MLLGSSVFLAFRRKAIPERRENGSFSAQNKYRKDTESAFWEKPLYHSILIPFYLMVHLDFHGIGAIDT